MKGDSMINADNKDKVDFLKYSIEYLEKRIALIDNKANIFIISLGVFVVAIMYVMQKIFDFQIVLVLFGLAIYLTIIFLLILAIRPTKCFFSLNVSPVKPKVEKYIMWPDNNFPLSTKTDVDYKEYAKKIDGLELTDILNNYKKTHFIALQLIDRTYKYYRWAVLFMKILVLWSAISLAIVCFMKWN